LYQTTIKSLRNVRDSLKIVFDLLPVTRLSLYHLDCKGGLSQGYTITRSGTPTEHMSETFARRVIEARRAIVIKDAMDLNPADWRQTMGRQSVRSIIGVPVMFQGQPAFVLLGDNLDQPDVFKNEHVLILDYLSKTMAVLCSGDALAKLQNISTFLPVCASCKRIRDDAGGWNDVDVYIATHTDLKVTHGICEACTKKLYPNLFPEL